MLSLMQGSHFTAQDGTKDTQRLNVVIAVCVLERAWGAIKAEIPIPLFGPLFNLTRWTAGSVILEILWCGIPASASTSDFCKSIWVPGPAAPRARGSAR